MSHNTCSAMWYMKSERYHKQAMLAKVKYTKQKQKITTIRSVATKTIFFSIVTPHIIIMVELTKL